MKVESKVELDWDDIKEMVRNHLQSRGYIADMNTVDWGQVGSNKLKIVVKAEQVR